MKYVVGLGNPGEKYKNNRHNAGFMLVDRLVDENIKDVELFKPQGFMNKSGVELKKQGVQGATLRFLYVVFDDLDIKLGEYKISFGKGPRDHNGLKNIYEQIGTKEFWHVRVGIDNGQFRGSGEEYVLSNFKPEEKDIIDNVLGKIVKELKNGLA